MKDSTILLTMVISLALAIIIPVAAFSRTLTIKQKRQMGWWLFGLGGFLMIAWIIFGQPGLFSALVSCAGFALCIIGFALVRDDTPNSEGE